jgi:hypothetical protein
VILGIRHRCAGPSLIGKKRGIKVKEQWEQAEDF